MTLELLRFILQAVSSLAIAGGFIFTALEFRKARAARLTAPAPAADVDQPSVRQP